MSRKRPRRHSNAELRIQSVARERADEARSRVGPETLNQAVTHFIEWEAFAFWVRAIVEAEGSVSTEMAAVLAQRCPDFVESEQGKTAREPAEGHFLWGRLVEWIRDRMFERERRDRWFDAVLYDAFRDPRYDRISSYWQDCRERWTRDRPTSYPSFEEWRAAAERQNPHS